MSNPSRIRWFRMLLLFCGVLALYLLGHYVAERLITQLQMEVGARNERMLYQIMMIATLVYVVLLALPFMPGVEIGFSMLMIFGSRIAFLVYVSTIVSLTIAYLVGRFMPTELVARACRVLGLIRAREFVNRLAPLSAKQRMELLVRDSPAVFVPYLVRHRYLALAVMFNLPGNILIGGGGGIALLAGMSRLFSFPRYLLTVALAVAPVPLIVSFFGLMF